MVRLAVRQCSSPGGGIGRRARLRGVWGNPYRFKSDPGHQTWRKRPEEAAFPFLTGVRFLYGRRELPLVVQEARPLRSLFAASVQRAAS